MYSFSMMTDKEKMFFVLSHARLTFHDRITAINNLLNNTNMVNASSLLEPTIKEYEEICEYIRLKMWEDFNE